MKILVTGGAGFIGSHVVDALVAAGHDVSVVDDLSTGRRHNLNPRARFYQVDIRDAALDDIIAQEKPDVVSHQAARANVRESMEKPILYADVNILGSLNLLESCRRHGVRKVIYASTGGASYGEPQQLPVPEDHPINPLDPYGASKHHVEHYLYLYRANYGLDYTILRYPNVFGPRQDPHGEAGVVAIFTGLMLSGGEPIINGTGEQERDFVDVSDVARANWLALSQGGGRVYNIGSGTGTSINRIYALLAELTSYDGPVVHGPSKQGEVYKIYLDASRARRELGWYPKMSLETGLARTVEYFRTSILAPAGEP
ncbi:MAG: NAD-dependent epimerase/dehydratase family protein [Anaerolineae bacterium]|nr:NAD-dependent epimerase/dehydratase family protein [Anaerolineae bacterium]